MNIKQYRAFAEILEKKGFASDRMSNSAFPPLEFYKWNQWTVQICFAHNGEGQVTSLSIHLFFDSEHLSWKNSTKVFPVDQIIGATCYLDQLLADMINGQIGLLAEALQD